MSGAQEERVSVTDGTMDLFLRISKHRMADNYLPKICRCLEAVNERQLWEHKANETNSIGGIILHIAEHLIRHIDRYNRVETTSSGIENHFPDNTELAPRELVVRIKEVFTAWQNSFDQLRSDESKVVDLYSVYHLIEHVSYHLGQVVDRVQRVTGESFQFVQNGLNEQGLRKIIENELQG